MVQVLTSDKLLTRHGFFSRNGGVSKGQYYSLNASFFVGDRASSVVDNRRILADCFGVRLERLFIPRQVHGSRVCLIRDHTVWHRNPKYHPRADALVSDSKNVAIGITTADCVPILLVDDENQVMAAIHGGWRGILGGVVANTIEAMEYMGAYRKNIFAAVGPCINMVSYPVGQEILEKLREDEKKFTARIDSQTLLDLPLLVRHCLVKAKVLRKNICLESARDTFANSSLFFSSRVSRSVENGALSSFSYGCQPSIISLKKSPSNSKVSHIT